MLHRLAALTGALILACACAAPASAADRYLAVDGTDAGDCSTPAAACFSTTYAFGQLSADDTLHFAAGNYTTANVPVGTTVGIAGLTLAGPQAGVPAPDRSGPEAVIPVLPGGALVLGAPSVTLDGLHILGDGAGVDGVNATASASVLNTRIEVSRYGIVAPGANTGTVAVEDSHLRTGSTPVRLRGPNAVLRRNLVVALGGNVGIDFSSPRSEATLLAEDNNLTANGYGVYVDSTSAVLRRNRIRSRNSTIGVVGDYASVDARQNWWGCNAGPGAAGCLTTVGSVDAATWLTLTASSDPGRVDEGGTSTLSASLARVSDGTVLPELRIPALPIGFGVDAGSLSADSAPLDEDGTAAVQFTAPDTRGQVTWYPALDAQVVPSTLRVGPVLPADGQFQQTSIAFGDVALGYGVTQTATLANQGDLPLTVSGMALAGAQSGDFAIVDDECLTETLDGGETCEVQVRLTPSALGARNAALQATTDGETPVVSVALQGTGVPVPRPVLSPGALDFGTVVRGATSASQPVTMTNHGPGALIVARLRGTQAGNSQFDVVDDECTGETIPHGASCTFAVEFAPTGVGEWRPVIQVVGNGRAVNLRLHGVGAEPVTLSPGTLPLRATVGGSTTGQITVTNNQATSLPLRGVDVSGTGRSQFVIANGCGRTLAAASSCTIDVTYSPTSATTSSTTLNVRTAAGLFTATLAGQGVPRWDVTPGGFSFGDLARGDFAARQFVVTNNTDGFISGITLAKAGTGKSQFVLDYGTCPTSGFIAPGESCEFQVTFAPQAVGTWTPTITVGTSLGNRAVPITGSGV